MSVGVEKKRIVPLLDLRAQHALIRDEVLAAAQRVIDSQQFILGEDVKAFEREIAAYCHAPFAVGCASGSDAVFLALLALGVGPGDRVLTTPYTFFATVGSVSRLGATPVFVDIDPHTFNLDINLVARALAAGPGVRVILPVHLFGGCADMDPLLALAREHGCVVIEDAAQAIGAEYRGRRAGSLTDLACFSFFPTKNLGGFGDGGILTTADQALADRLAALRIHGRTGKYLHQWVGVNSRLDTLQAAVLRVKLRHLDDWTAARQRHADFYRRLLEESGAPVTVPRPAAYQTRHIYNQFVIRCPDRDRLRSWLQEQGVGTEVYYPVPLHLQPCYARLGYRAGDLPVSEALAAESLALPVYPELSDDDIAYVCRANRDFYA